MCCAPPLCKPYVNSGKVSAGLRTPLPPWLPLDYLGAALPFDTAHFGIARRRH